MEEKNKNILVFLSLGIPTVFIIKKLHNLIFPKHIKTHLCIELGGQSVRTSLITYNSKTKSYKQKKTFKIPTPTPIFLLKFLIETYKNSEFDKISISSFGPINLKKGKDYGKILKASSNKKISYSKINLQKLLSSSFPKKSIKLETDVNAAALGEFHFGKHGAKNSLAYITLGTGIGVGLIINSKPVHGYLHPEGGHMLYFKKC